MKKILNLLSGVFYPNYCINCGQIMNQHENFLCLECRLSLATTEFHLKQKNDFYELFSPQISLMAASSLFFFQKEGPAQHLIHALKYHGKEQIGHWLGEWLGQYLAKSEIFQTVDAVVPVPMHPNKEKQRGYNQVTLFGQALAKHLQALFVADALIKTHNVSSQTQKNKLHRNQSTKYLYALHNCSTLENKHILLVDDVVTTGATLLSCGNELLKTPNTRLSFATMAYVPK